jgi:hypothetical protein
VNKRAFLLPIDCACELASKEALLWIQDILDNKAKIIECELMQIQLSVAYEKGV